METKPEVAFIQSLRFIRFNFGHIAADVFDLLYKKRTVLLNHERISHKDSWFYYLGKDLLSDFGCKKTKTMRVLDPGISELEKAGLIEKRNSIHSRLGSVREYRVNDKVFTDKQKQLGDTWIRNKPINSNDKIMDDNGDESNYPSWP